MSKEKDPNNRDLPKELQDCLKFLVNKYEKEDSWVRKQQVKLWKKNEEFWHGIQYIFWSESKEDWLTPAEARWFEDEEGREGSEGPFYDFALNIYRAHGESIIAALAAQMPTVRFPPDNAEDEDDILTSKTYAKIADLIQRHNKARVMMLYSFLVAWNQGNIYYYHAPRADKAFGMTHIENFKKVLECENCGKEFPVDDDEDLLEGAFPCPECGQPLHVTTALDSVELAPKSRVMIDVFGGLHVKTSFWARSQGECSYLLKSQDQPKPFLKKIYDHIADKIDSTDNDAQMYERMARTPSSFSSMNRADDNQDLATHRQIWLRTWTFEGLPKEKEKEKKELYKRFPNGCYVAMVGDVYAESRDEDLDKYWTVVKTSLATYLQGDALGQPLIPVQELRNVTTNLTVETIEQGIGSMFADPDVLNFNVYSKHEARPGLVYPARPRPNHSLQESFFEGGRATLSKEVGPFQQQLDKDGQFVVGDYPSLYGGPGEVASRTLGEYQQSRAQALQRLKICWDLFVSGWATLMEKCVHIFAENMIEDERFVSPDPSKKDCYINVWIKRSEMVGRVGEVEPEGADIFPMNTLQKQALFFKLLEFNNQMINMALFDPQNRRIIADILGFPDLYIPGEDQQIKQALEISDMIKGVPVQTNPIVDDASVHAEVCRNFLASYQGIELEKQNPQSYQLIMQHLQEHLSTDKKNKEDQANEMAQQYVNVKSREQVLRTAVKSQTPKSNGGGPTI